MKVQLRVWGGTPEQRKYARSMIRFATHRLMGDRLARKCTINVGINQNLFNKEGIYGDCINTDRDYRPREFSIRLDANMNNRSFLETLAHELVHAKQWAKDEMKELVGGVVRFNKQYYTSWETSYWDQPWEIEAHGRERGLFEMWVDSEKLGKKKWTQEKVWKK
jgi:hypothetical protein